MDFLYQILSYSSSWKISFTISYTWGLILILLLNIGLYYLNERLTVILNSNIVEERDVIIKKDQTTINDNLAVALNDRYLEISADRLLHETNDKSLIISKSLATLWSNTTANKCPPLVLYQQIANAKHQSYFDMCCGRAKYVIEPDHEIVPEKAVNYLRNIDLDEFVEKPYLSAILLATINKMNYQTYIASPEYINQLLEITDK